jgi:hypothetical protein
MNVTAQKTELKGYALIRDKNGKPKIDDYENCPEAIKLMLTDEERQHFEKRIK